MQPTHKRLDTLGNLLWEGIQHYRHLGGLEVVENGANLIVGTLLGDAVEDANEAVGPLLQRGDNLMISVWRFVVEYLVRAERLDEVVIAG